MNGSSSKRGNEALPFFLKNNSGEWIGEIGDLKSLFLFIGKLRSGAYGSWLYLGDLNKSFIKSFVEIGDLESLFISKGETSKEEYGSCSQILGDVEKTFNGLTIETGVLTSLFIINGESIKKEYASLSQLSGDKRPIELTVFLDGLELIFLLTAIFKVGPKGS